MIRWAASRPAVVWATSVVILLGGIVSFTRLALATRTTVELPRLSIGASWSGASAELMEMYVASPIESAIQGVRGVRRTSSRSSESSASITAELDPKADVQLARLAILERLEILAPEFPRGVSRPSVRNFVPTELQEPTLFTLTLTGPYTAGALQKLADEVLSPRLSAVPGVAGVNPAGGTEFSVAISYDSHLLRQLGVAPAALGAAIREARLVQSLGEEQRGASEFQVTLRDQPDAIEQLGDLPVRGRGRVFRLGDLATVRPEEDARGRFNRINGQPAITIDINRQAGADAIKTAAALRGAIDAIRPTLPPRATITIVNDESEELADQIRNLLLRGAIAFGAVILVIAFMLRDLRAIALVMGSAAVSIAGTAFGLYVFQIPANMLTLAGLAMGIGILVQNGLVVTERLGTVPDTREARAGVAARITPAVLGATLTTAVVLFPFLYLQGNARAAFMPFAAAFVMALGWSVLASVVMIPALARGHRIHEASWPRTRRIYARLLMPAIRFRWVTIGLTAIALGGLTWVFVKKVPRFAFGGFGFGERTYVTAFISFPQGSDPVTLDRAMREMEDIAIGRNGVEQVRAQSNGITGAVMRVLFTREHELTAIPLEMEERLTQRAVFIGGANVSVRGQGPGFSSGFGSSSMASYRIRVMGYSFSGVEQMALDIKERLERIPRVRNVDITTASGFSREKAFGVVIEPNRAALARFGLTSDDMAQAVRREIAGSVGSILLEIGGEELPVQVKTSGANTRSLDELREALIPTPGGGAVSLGSVSVVSERELLSTIDREDQQYMRTVAYEFRGPNRLAQRTHDAFMKTITPPAGYKVEEANYGFGTRDESEKGLWLVFAIGVTLVILAVALVFDSVWATSIIFLSLPIALGGVIFAFWVMKAAFTREAAVGVILVIGLAVNQSILMTDAGLARRRRRVSAGEKSVGLGPREALRSAMDRAGMVILVTLTSLSSLIPLAIGTSTQDIFGAIALATAGGTIAGTFGALFIVPALLVGRRGARPPRKKKAETVPIAPIEPAPAT
ncbi:MAG TPA: efflux RND transporter permease subunit [Gemmatimonadaceae bacterium]